jgi:D-xylulose reductase
MSSEDGAMVEPTAVAVQICKVADLRANQTVLVFGCGPIGVLCQAVAKSYGAKKVIAVDISKARTEFAKKYAADGVFVPERAPAGTDPVEASRAIGEKIVADFGIKEGFDVVLECTGAEPCVQAGVFAAKKGGTYVQAGMGKEVNSPSISYVMILPLTISLECCIPNHYSMHSGAEHQGIN